MGEGQHTTIIAVTTGNTTLYGGFRIGISKLSGIALAHVHQVFPYPSLIQKRERVRVFPKLQCSEMHDATIYECRPSDYEKSRPLTGPGCTTRWR